MPFTPVEVPKCPKCNRSVFAAEEKLAGGYKWHKACFKCAMCNKMLDSTNCSEHEKELFCKTCHGRRYGPKGYGFGGGAGALSMDTGERFGNTQFVSSDGNRSCDAIKAPEGEGCPTCAGFVYHADQIFSKGRAWHKECFKCKICRKHLNSRIACDGPNNTIYCNGCYRKMFGIRGYGYGHAGPALTSGDYFESNGPPKCSFNETTTLKADLGLGCLRCGGKVFHAEQMVSKEKIFHKKCFTCKECHRPLDSVLCCDSPDGDVHCKSCYSRLFGVKGYGFAGGAGFLQSGGEGEAVSTCPSMDHNTSTILGAIGDADTCPRCQGQVFHAERMISKNKVYHKKCFACYDCHRPLDSTLCCDASDGNIFCRNCYSRNYGPKGFGFGGTGSVPALLTTNFPADSRIQTEFLPGVEDNNNTDKKDVIENGGCSSCGNIVYEAEKIMAAGKFWHKRCFQCVVCKKNLDSVTVNDGPDGGIYCKLDYANRFGLQGYGFGQGAGVLQSDAFGTKSRKFQSENAYVLP